MKFVVTSCDGKVRANVTADSLEAALDEVAEGLGCVDYEDMCRTLNYRGSDFRVARIVEPDEAPAVEHDKPGQLKAMARSALEAFKRDRQ